MSDKRSQTTADALRQCFSELGVPVRVYTDEGSEFQNSTVESLLTSLNVALVTTRGYANFVERMIRTLKERLRIRHLTFGEPWDKLLPDVVKQYNDQAHSATRMAPKLAALDENNDTVRARLQKRAKPSRRPPLAVGDIVRIARPHTAGRRVRDVQFGAEAYPVQEIVHEGGVKRYRVNERLYLRHDLLKIDDIRAPSGRSRILGEDDQPLVPRVSRAMQQQYSRDVNRRLALERMTGDVATFVYAQDEDDAPLSNLAQAAPRVPPPPVRDDDDAPLARPAKAPPPVRDDDDAPLARLAKASPPTPDDDAPLARLAKAPPPSFPLLPVPSFPPASLRSFPPPSPATAQPSPFPPLPPATGILAPRPKPKALPFQEAPITGGSSSSRDRELMPPPAPVTRRDVLALEEREQRAAVSPPESPIPVRRPRLERRLDRIQASRRVFGIEEPRLDAEFYRRVAEINGVIYFRPRNAQEKYTAVRDAMELMRVTPGASEAECDELVREYDRLFDLVSFSFPDPERQRAEDLGLEG